MKLTVTWKQARPVIESYVLIKYGVISDAVKFIRHGANIVGETLNSVTSGVDEISGQVSRTVDAMNYQTETVAANFSNADKSLFQMTIMVIIIFALLYRFGPVLYAMFVDSIRGETKAKRGETKAKRGDKEASRGDKEARFNKWVARYGGDYKTKKEAKAAFNAFEKEMGYN